MRKPSIIFEGRNSLQLTIYHWKGNLSKTPIHFRYRQNILISRLYEQFSRNDSAKAPQWGQKKFKLLNLEHTVYHFKAHDLVSAFGGSYRDTETYFRHKEHI